MMSVTPRDWSADSESCWKIMYTSGALAPLGTVTVAAEIWGASSQEWDDKCHKSKTA